MARGAKVLRWTAGIVAGTVVVVLLGLFALSRTEWARDRVRTAVEEGVSGAVEGSVRIGGVRGNLLREAVLDDVVILDPEGERVAEIARVEVRYALRPLLERRIRITDLELVDPAVRVVQDRAGRWNVAQAFAGTGEDVPEEPTAEPGFGSWIRIDEATIQNGRVRLRTPAETAEDDEGRTRIEEVGGEAWIVRVARDLEVTARDLVLADPEAPISGRLAGFSAEVLPFRPPALEVRHLEGGVELAEDSVHIRNVALELPDSRLTGRAVLAGDSEAIRGRLRVERLTGADLAWLDPGLPPAATARLDAVVERTAEGDLELAASDLRVEAAGARLTGRAAVRPDEPVELGEVDLRFEGVDAEALREVTGADVPLDGTVTGAVRATPLAGAYDDTVRLDAGVEHVSDGAGRSSVRLAGRAALAERSVEELAVELAPLRVAALEPLTGELPVGGGVEGSVVVSGGVDGPVRARVDLEHRGVAGRTRAGGSVALGPPGAARRVDARLRLPVVALGTVGAFAPEAGLHGTARGALRAEGPTTALGLELDLAVDGGGELSLAGTLDAERPGRSYDLRVAFDAFDGSALSTRAPATSLDGTVAVRGEGTDPATMDVEVTADLRDAAPGELAPRTLRTEAALRDGLLQVEDGAVRVGSATADLEGAFGLAAERTGEMDVELVVDSLSGFAGMVGGEDGTGEEAEDGAEESGALPALAGRLELEGTVSGGLRRVDARGEVRGEDLVGAGVRIERLTADVQGEDLRGERPELAADLRADSLSVAGMAYERLEARVAHAGSAADGGGSAALALVQDPDRDYRARVGYALEADAREVRVEELSLRFDTVQWASTAPGTVRWAGTGVAVDSLELRSDAGGRVFLAGRYGGEGPAPGPDDRLVVEIDDLSVAQIAGLLQDTSDVSGRLGLRLRAEGPAADGRVRVSASLDEPRYSETELPALRAEASYRPADLAAELRLLAREGTAGEPGDTLLAAEGSAAVDLFGADVDASRALDVRIRADSLPLEGLPRFTEAVSDVRGRLRADVTVRGSLDAPEVAGGVGLDLGRMDVEWPNLQIRDAVGAIRMEGETVVLDSLRARSGGGTLRLAGEADLSDLDAPRVDLAMVASDARVLDNDIGRNVRIDGEVTVEGPVDSLAVGGGIRLLEGVFFVPEGGGEVVDLDAALSRRALAAIDVPEEGVVDESPLLQGLRVQVELVVSPNTWLRLSEGTVEIRTPEDGEPLRIRYDRGESRIVLDGSVNADRGEYQFAGRRFELRTGTATFLPTATLDPLLDLTATYEVPRPGREALSIQLHVSGRLQEPRLTLTSNANPPLSQTDLISYLVFGAPSGSLLQPGSSALGGAGGGELGALATQQLASLAVGTLVEEAFASLERSATQQGLDVVHIEPAELPDELAFDGYVQNLLRGTQIEAGSYLTRRFFLGIRGRATTEVWPGFRAEYRSPGGFRWTAMWEPRYLPTAPAFDPDLRATRTRVLGGFLFWESRAGAAAAGATAGADGEGEPRPVPEAGGDPGPAAPP